MRIGLANIFSFRPHVEHLYYLSVLLKQAGHGVHFLTCDSAVSNCYPRALKHNGRIKECSKCILGGVRSYPVQNITGITSGLSGLSESELDMITHSSACTLNRTESETEWSDTEILRTKAGLYEPADATFHSALQWIKDNRLEGVICFNGRMEMTRAVTYACEKAGIPYITHERTWLGDGLRLIPNANCLSIAALNELAAEYADKPLTRQQAALAGKLAADRFLQKNSLEWRLYNKNPEPAAWPLSADGPRVLVLPSSKNEFAGNPEWKTGWPDNTRALDDFFEAFSIDPSQVVLRCHPNWAEYIGKVPGDRSRLHYESWAGQRGVHCIKSDEKANTYDLIQQADIVVLNGGSSAVEAGVCGKQVVCLSPASYGGAGFVRMFPNRESLYEEGALTPINPETVIRKSLRFLYLRAHRFPQYADFVKAVETTRYKYYQGADAQRLIDMFKTGKLRADDPTCADNSSAEDDVVKKLANRQWSVLAEYRLPLTRGKEIAIGRRPAFRWVDGVRSLFPRGDL